MLQEESGILESLAIHPSPVGTLEEVRREGLDPEKVGSCAPPEKGVRGCTYWKACRFGQARACGYRGHSPEAAFKGTLGPRYVGYYLQTTDNAQKEDDVPCFVFVGSIQYRMDQGNINRQQGLPGELIEVIAHQGEPIQTKTQKWRDETNKLLGFHFDEKERPVHAFPRPGLNPEFNYEQKLSKRARERRRQAAEAEDQAWRNQQGQARAEYADAAPEDEAETTLDLDATKAVAAPAKSKEK